MGIEGSVSNGMGYQVGTGMWAISGAVLVAGSAVGAVPATASKLATRWAQVSACQLAAALCRLGNMDGEGLGRLEGSSEGSGDSFKVGNSVGRGVEIKNDVGFGVAVGTAVARATAAATAKAQTSGIWKDHSSAQVLVLCWRQHGRQRGHEG